MSAYLTSASDASDLSVVFQGPVLGAPGDPEEAQVTRRCIAQARAVLPGAEIILSTWRGADAGGLPVDRLVLNEDPGSWMRDDGVACNGNRQIVSTRGGLEAASRRYAAKVRTDTALSSAGFRARARAAGARPERGRVFEERILVLEKYTRDPARISLLHFVSDLFQYGLREDLLRLWSVPLAEAANHLGWSRGLRPLLAAPFPEHRAFMKYADEQYVWTSCLRQSGFDVRLDYFSQCRIADIATSERLMTANFVVASEEEAGVVLPPRFATLAYPETCYRSAGWDRLASLYAAEGSALARGLRVAHVAVSSRLALLKMAARRLWPANFLRGTLHADHSLRRAYRRAKSRLRIL